VIKEKNEKGFIKLVNSCGEEEIVDNSKINFSMFYEINNISDIKKTEEIVSNMASSVKQNTHSFLGTKQSRKLMEKKHKQEKHKQVTTFRGF
jgi:hypothetical protein